MYSRCFCWFPGPLTPSDTASFLRDHDISCLLSAPLYSAAYTFLIVSIFIFVLQQWVSDSAAGLCTVLPLTMIGI